MTRRWLYFPSAAAEVTLTILTTKTDQTVWYQTGVESGATLTEGTMTQIGDVENDIDVGSTIQSAMLAINGSDYVATLHIENASGNDEVVWYSNNGDIDADSDSLPPPSGKSVERVFSNQHWAQAVFSTTGSPGTNLEYRWYRGPFGSGSQETGSYSTDAYVAPDDSYTDSSFMDPFPGSAIVHNRLILNMASVGTAGEYDSLYYDVAEIGSTGEQTFNDTLKPARSPVTATDLLQLTLNPEYVNWQGDDIYYLDGSTIKHYTRNTGTDRGSLYGQSFTAPTLPTGHTGATWLIVPA